MAAFCGVEITDEDSSHLAHVCAGRFECDRQQCRREAGQRCNKVVLLRYLSSNLSLNSQAQIS